MIRSRVEKLLLLLGLVAIGFWAWSHIRTSIFQRQAGAVFDRSIHNPSPTLGVTPSVKNGDLLGRLTIPRLHLSAMVREGDDARSLDVALGHIPGTPLPGQPGNVAIAGHRDTLFRGLGRVSANDLIQFQTLAGHYYSYLVESTAIVKPRNIEVLKPSPYSEITLVTCYPFDYVGSAPDRFIVKARLIPAVSAQPSSPPAPPSPSPPRRKSRPTGHKVIFEVSERHSRQLTPGISLGLSWADASRQRVSGWLWIMPQRHTIWLRDQATNAPIVFRGGDDGRTHELVLTRVAGNSTTGYLLEPGLR